MEQSPDIYRGRLLWGYIDDKKKEQVFITGPNRYSCTHDIETPFTIGRMSMVDILGFQESTSFYSNLQKRRIFAIAEPYSAEDTKFKFRFDCGLYDVGNTLHPLYGASNPNAKEATYTLVAEPAYSALHRKRIRKCYKQEKLSNIIRDILTDASEGAGWIEDFVDIFPSEPDPIIPLFIVPYWTPLQAIKYLSNYAPGGPLKMFMRWDYMREIWILCVYPLGALMAGKLGYGGTYYPSGTKLRADEAGREYVDTFVMRPNYLVNGPNMTDPKSYLGGESLLNFDYFYGVNEKENNWSDTIPGNSSSYKFQTPDKNKSRNYLTPIAGDYKNGAAIVTRQGDFLLYEQEPKGDYTMIMNERLRNWSIDNEPKNLVEYKMANRFYNRFHNQISVKATVPPSINIVVGYVYDLVLPSFNRNPDLSCIRDSTLSGKYLLTSVEHNMAFLRETPGGLLDYECVCTFVKTGLEQSKDVYDKYENSTPVDIIESPLSRVDESDTVKDFKKRMAKARANKIYRE
jgi:hypothetical protein